MQRGRGLGGGKEKGYTHLTLGKVRVVLSRINHEKKGEIPAIERGATMETCTVLGSLTCLNCLS